MSRKTVLKIQLAALILLLAVVVGVGMMWIANDGALRLDWGRGERIASREFENVTALEADLTSYAIRVEAAEGDRVTAEFYSQGLGQAPAPEMTQEGGRLTIREPAGPHGFLRIGRVVVKVPAGLDYTIHGVSCSIRLEAPAGDADLRTVSGSIRVYEAGGSLTAVSTSGSIRVFAPWEQLALRGTSGSLRAAAGADTEAVRMDTVSGSVRLRLEGVSGYTLDHHTVSGSVKDSYHGVDYAKDGQSVWGDGTIPIHAATTSGSIRLEDWTD